MRKAPIRTPVVDHPDHTLTPPWQRYFGSLDQDADAQRRYVIVFANTGTPVIATVAAHYTVKRASRGKDITITALGGPSGGNAEFNLWCDGTKLNQNALVITPAYPSLTPEVFPNVAPIVLAVDKVITLQVVSVNGLGNVTVELFAEEI